MILVTRPNHDGATNYLYYWSGKVIEEAKKKSVEVIDLAKNKANRKNFISYLTKEKPSIVWVNGHGNDDCVTGFNNDILISTSDKNLDLQVKVFVARSCRCGKLLGKFLVNNGVGAFIGYVDDYIIKTSRKYTTRPWLDPMAGLFLEPSNYIITSLIKGHSVDEANNKSKKMMLMNLKNTLVKDADDKNDLGRWLWHDYKNQVALGRLEIKV